MKKLKTRHQMMALFRTVKPDLTQWNSGASSLPPMALFVWAGTWQQLSPPRLTLQDPSGSWASPAETDVSLSQVRWQAQPQQWVPAHRLRLGLCQGASTDSSVTWGKGEDVPAAVPGLFAWAGRGSALPCLQGKQGLLPGQFRLLLGSCFMGT